MSKNLKKAIASILVVLMLVSAVPLQGFVGIELPAFFSTKAKAVSPVKDYNATAGVEYAKRYALSYNREWYFYSSGGDCANYVSQALYAGGMKMDGTWHSMDYNNTGYRMDNYAWIRAHELMDYLVSQGGTKIYNPSVDQFSLGDVVFYDWNRNDYMDHTAIVTGFSGSTPLVSCHSEYEWQSKYNHEYTLGYNRNNITIVLVKLYGRTCTPNNASSYSIYRPSNSVRIYDTPGGRNIGTSSNSVSAVRITETRSYNGIQYGYGMVNRQGTYGWIQLSGCSYLGYWNKIEVNHIMGQWYTVTRPTCLQRGVDRRDCSRCSYSETRDTGGGSHEPGAAATCTTPQLCTVCSITLVPALGHVIGDWEEVTPSTCVEHGKAIKYCSRGCPEVYEEKELPLAPHNFTAALDGATCTGEGWVNYECTVCGYKYSSEAELDGDSMWSDWVTTPNLNITDSEYIQTKTQYRKRDKEYTTAPTDTLSGYTLYDSTYVWSDYGNWSGWQDSSVSSSEERQVETRQVTMYNYYHYRLDKGNGGKDISSTPIGMTEYNNTRQSGWLAAVSEERHTISLEYELGRDTSTSTGTYVTGGGSVYNCYAGYTSGHENCSVDNWNVKSPNWFEQNPYKTQKTQYRYRNRSKIWTYYFYKWSDWSDWGDIEITASSENEEVETRTLYRYKLTALGHDVENIEVAETKYATCTDEGYIKYKCPRCGSVLEEYTEILDCTGHNNMSDWEDYDAEKHPQVELPYESENWLVSFCQNVDQNTGIPCSYYLIKDDAHYYEENARLEATCEEDGYIHYVCTNPEHEDCEKTVTLEKTGHGDWKITRTIEPSCEESGIDLYECMHIDENTGEKCTYTEEKEVPMLGHEEVEDSGYPANCTEWGLTDGSHCSRCNKELEKQERIAPLGHTPKNDDENSNQLILHNEETFIKEIQGDCENPGELIYGCTREGCDYTETDYVVYEHDMQFAEHREADCNNPGYDIFKCGNCTWTDIRNEEDALGHEFLKEDGSTTKDINDSDIIWTVETEATCTEPGIESCYCIRYGEGTCTEKHERLIDPNGHQWGEEEHHATCTSADAITHTCSVCGTMEVIGEDDSLGHDLENLVVAERKEATCTQNGYIKYKCVRENNGEICNTIIEEKTEILPALGHDLENLVIVERKEPTCTENGYIKYKCVRENNGEICNITIDAETEILNKIGHDWSGNWVVTKEPTIHAKGEETLYCKNDRSHTQTREIDKIASYTATFMIGDTVIDTVTFEAGATSINEPKIPEKDNYIGYWDEYTLKDEDIIIYGHYDRLNDASDLETDKKSEYKDGIATITLEATAKTKAIKLESSSTKPVDIVLVLDQSGSMDEKLGTSTRRDELIKCANEFVDQVYDNAVKTGAQHRVAVVGFAMGDYTTNASSYPKYGNTEVITTLTGKSVQYDKATATVYQQALMPIVGTDGNINQSVKGVLDKNHIKANGATAADLGLDMAKNVFANNPLGKNEERERIVVFLTDGVPTQWSNTEDRINPVAKNAIKIANDIKNSQNAKIYSIGIDAQANPSANFVNNIRESGCYNVTSSSCDFDFNRFLHYVSSNYADSQAMTNGGEGDKEAGYYMAVNNADDLSSIFNNILYSSVVKVVAFDKVTLVDTISKEFTLTMEQEAAMRANLKATLGLTDGDIQVTRNADGTTTVRFENIKPVKLFDSDNNSYYRAAVSFDVTANKYALDAGTYNTNTSDAGVEYDGETVSKFDVPTINIPGDRNIIEFTIDGQTYSIYESELGDTVTVPVTDLAEWNIPDGTVVSDRYAVFEATQISDDEYTITWVVDGKETTTRQRVGSVIKPIAEPSKDGMDFAGWSPSVAHTMPARDLTYTATFKPAHVHSFVKDYVYGDCESGVTTIYACDCGEQKTETSVPSEHQYTAVISESEDGSIEQIVCEVCGNSNGRSLTFQYRSSTSNRVQYFDLNLYYNEVKVQPDGTILIYIPLSMNMSNNLKIYRIDGTKRIECNSWIENGFIVFEADHFSLYAICEVDSETDELLEEPDYNKAVCMFNGHDYQSVVTEPTCTSNGFTTHTCTVCGDTYTDNTVPATGHKDENGDGICDICQEEIKADPSKNCTHICHNKNSFVQFIYKIVRFFWKLFGINKYCSCGVAHY